MQTLKFMPSTKECELVVPAPKPAKVYIPDWYKGIKPPDRNKPVFNNEGVQTNTNVKMCQPFLDTFTTGYIQETHTDIHINVLEDLNGNLNVNVSFPIEPEQLSWRSIPTQLAVTSEYYPIEFTWVQHWVPIAPKGYSVLHTHPLNRFDLPFYSLNAIVDSDVFNHYPSGSYPFFLKKEFNNVLIPAGTPMFQMIPIKREAWETSSEFYNEETILKKRSLIRKHIFDGYRDKFWQKKSYN
jgi:hypothetical protein